MATGERRLGPSTRRGMTVLGKIPAVPKPINLPSQRLENRGLDSSVDIVPRGTFTWGTARSPPTATSAWGNTGLASSPPVPTGARNTASGTVSDSSSTSILAGLAQKASRPLSAGGTHPSSAGSTYPLSASTTANRTWGGAAKLDEQVHPSRFNFTNIDFPTLGSEKSPNLRPQQTTTPLQRPTSADATNEWHTAHTGSTLNRPTSADASKNRKPVHPGVVPADRPTSADPTLKDKERHQPDTRLPTFPQSGDDNLPNNQRNMFYKDVVGHEPPGPGPGPYLPLKDNYNFYPSFVQHGMVSGGSRGFPVGPVMYPIVSQYDAFGNRLAPSNVENRPGIYGGYLPGPGVDHFSRSGLYQKQYRQHGPSEPISCGTVQVGPQPYGTEVIMLPEPPVTSERRGALALRDPVFEQQRAGWARRNLTHVGSPLDSPDYHSSPTSVVATCTKLQKQDIHETSWGREIEHSGWVNSHRNDTTIGVSKSEALHKPSKLQQTMPQVSSLVGSSERRGIESAQGGHAGDSLGVYYSNSSAIVSSQPLAPERVDKLTDTSLVAEPSTSFALYSKYEIPVKIKEAVGTGKWVSGSQRVERDSQPLGSGIGAGTSYDKQKLGEVANKEQYACAQRIERDSQPPGAGLGAGTSDDKQKPVEVANKEQYASAQVTAPALDAIGGFSGEAHETSGVMSSSKGAPQEQPASQTSQPLKEVGEPRTSQSKKPSGMVFGLKLANQRFEDTTQGDEQMRVKYDAHSTDGLDSCKNTHARKRSAASHRSLKKDVLPASVSQDTEDASDICLPNVPEGNTIDGRSSSSRKPNVDISFGVEGTTGSNMTCTVQMESHFHIEQKATPAGGPGPALSEAEHRILLIPPPVEGQALNDNMPHRKTKRHSYHTSLKRAHQSHDKHNVNEGLVWAPRKAPTTKVEDMKDEAHPSFCQKVVGSLVTSSEDHMVHTQQNQSTESHKHAEQVQEVQSAASAPQKQGQQIQQLSVADGRKEADETQYHEAADINSGNKGPSVRKDHEKLIKPRQSLASSDVEEKGILEVKTNVQVKEFGKSEDHQKKDNGRPPVPAPRKSKDASTIYVPRRARHLQGQCEEEEQRLHQGQTHLPKGERVCSKDAGVFAALMLESAKNEGGKVVKHQEVSKHKFLVGERQLPILEKRLEAEGLEHWSFSATGPGMVEEDKNASSSNMQKLARQHEMLKTPSAAARHQERRTATAQVEHAKPETQIRDSKTTSQSSPLKREMQIYVPKANRKQLQDIVASDGEWQKQVQGSHKDYLSADQKLWQHDENLQSSSIDKRDGMESSTLKPARQQRIQGQHSTTRGRPPPRVLDVDEQAWPSLEGIESGSESKPQSAGISDPGGGRNDTKINTVSKNKKEAKYYIPKPQQQHYVPQGDQGHATSPQERSKRPPKVSRTGPSKKSMEIERYTPKPARQQTITSQGDAEGDKRVDSGEELEQQRGRDDKASGHNTKSQTLSARLHNAARLQMKDDPKEASERMEHPNDDVYHDCGPKLRRQDRKEESLLVAEDNSAKQKHNIHPTKMREATDSGGHLKEQYHYQPVIQPLSASKPEERDFHAANLDHGQNRYGRRDGPARYGTKYGQGHRYRDADPTR